MAQLPHMEIGIDPTGPDNAVDYKIRGNVSTRQMHNMWMIWACIWIWLMWACGGTECYQWWNGIDQWSTYFHLCIQATGRHFDYSLRHILVKMLLTVIN